MAADVSDLVSFDEFITHWAADRPSRIAMREEDRLFTYAELEERTARVASALRAAGLEKGDRIAWIGKNSDLYFTLFFGAARAGIVMAPIDDTCTIAKFIDKRGPGLQQLAYRVSDIDALTARLRGQGVRLLYDAPRRGTANSRINFIHPKDAGGVLIELVEPATENQDRADH
ncbi:MAG: AMP-binding protein [Mycobacterium sp.]